MMEEVLRFMAIRPPEALEEESPNIELGDVNDPITVDSVRGGGESESEPPSLGELASVLDRVREWLLDSNNDNAYTSEIVAAIAEILGGQDVNNSDEWQIAKESLATALIDGKFRKGRNRDKLVRHADLRRTMAAVEIALSECPPEDIRELRQILNSRFVIATPTPPDPDETRQSTEFKEKKEAALTAAREKIATHEGLSEAIKFFEQLPTHLFQIKGVEVDVELKTAQKSAKSSKRRDDDDDDDHKRAAQPTEDLDDTIEQPPAKPILVIDEAATDQLSQVARDAIAATGINIGEIDIESTLTELKRHQVQMQLDTQAIIEPFTAEQKSVAIGANRFSLEKPLADLSGFVHANSMVPGNYYEIALPEFEYRPDQGEIDFTVNCSPIVPSGLGQLLVVRQHLKCYERSEISHIENVLKGETRKRDHRRSMTTEETFLVEQITERTEERHLETTERFELSSEVQRISKEELKRKAELNVSGKYGPTVEFEVTAGIDSSNSKEKTTKVAQEFAQETTSKAVNKITERVREQRTFKVIEEIEEANHHGFVNNSDSNITGIYQWLNKVYEAQIYDYGLRLLFDIIIPEPAAFLISAFNARQSETTPRLSEPPEFKKRPDQLTESNYYLYVQQYGAKDVQAPPEPLTTVSKTFILTDHEDDWEKVRHAEGGEINIPEGYEAVYGYMTATKSGSTSKNSAVAIHLDRYWYNFPMNQTINSTPMNNQQGAIPVAWRAFAVSAAAATIEIRCRRTVAAMNQWRLDTHEKIRTAYEARLSEYHAEQDKLALEVKEELEGGNPADNKRLAETELKRAAISIIANKRQLFDLIDIDFHDIPFVDLSARLNADPIIRFLEQAFEWENMNYLYYPYFWGRKEPHWKQKILFESSDSDFGQFVRAGAARLQLAVRPGFEDAVDHFLKTCEPWQGGDLPTITDPLYLPFADELAAQLGRPSDEVPVGDPWDVRVPTNLVILRADSNLPKWKKEGDEWVEADPDDDTGVGNGNGDDVIVD